MTTGLIMIATAIVIAVGAVIWYLYDEYKTYQDKYEWAQSQRNRAVQELFETKVKFAEVNKIDNKREKRPSEQTITINVDTDEVVRKVMDKVNKKIAEANKREEVFIKIDGKEINIKELTKAMKKAEKEIR